MVVRSGGCITTDRRGERALADTEQLCFCYLESGRIKDRSNVRAEWSISQLEEEEDEMRKGDVVLLLLDDEGRRIHSFIL